jgi:hypothetical protein
VELQRRGVPTVVICTTAFAVEARARAKSLGMPAVPLVLVEHPIAGLPEETIRAKAEAVFPRLLEALQAREPVTGGRQP